MAEVHETFFGQPWPSGICELLEQGPTPVGEECMFCDEAIIDGDQGSWVQGVHMTDGGPVPCWHPTHRECQIMQLLGGLAHMQKRCRCFGGPGYTDEEKEWSARQEALACWAFFVRTQTARFN